MNSMLVGIQRPKVQMKSAFSGDRMEEMLTKDRTSPESPEIGVGPLKEGAKAEPGGDAGRCACCCPVIGRPLAARLRQTRAERKSLRHVENKTGF